MKKHLIAKPKDKKLRTKYPLLSPSKAQELYPDTISDIKDFCCSTNGCEAPITCRCMDKPDTTASFIEGKRKINCHIPECEFSSRITKNNREGEPVEPKFSVKFTGDYVGNAPRDIFTHGLGLEFLSEEHPEAEQSSKTEEEDLQKSKKSRVNPKNKKPFEKKQYRKRISDIGTAVFIFESNKNTIIEDWFLGQFVPIRKYFHQIQNNTFQKRIKDSVPIYYGNAFIVDRYGSNYRINFGIKKEIEGVKYRPHFLVNKEFIDTNFPFLTDRLTSNPKKPFRAYIRSRFQFYPDPSGYNDKILQFKHKDNDLLNLIYFSDK
ncbi:hypothetical protein SFC81_00330 [Enterococcus faecalis]